MRLCYNVLGCLRLRMSVHQCFKVLYFFLDLFAVFFFLFRFLVVTGALYIIRNLRLYTTCTWLVDASHLFCSRDTCVPQVFKNAKILFCATCNTHLSVGNAAKKALISRNRFQTFISKLYFNNLKKPYGTSKTYYTGEVIFCLKHTFSKVPKKAICESMTDFKGTVFFEAICNA